ncbi:MAG: glucosaminidase domain-containing protein [Saprospiraceae bacterium]
MNLRMMKKVMILLMYTNAMHASTAENGRMMSYIETYKYLAIQEMSRTQIPASIKLAQAILESQAGTSLLAIKAKNHFGIKCGDKWGGSTYYLKDDDYDRQGNHIQSCFRAYNDVAESFKAHSNFISGEGKMSNRYASLFTLSRDDYKGWAEGLQKAGYATHPLYARRLISLIEDYKLFLYDSKVEIPVPSTPPGFFMEKEKSPFNKVNGLKSIYISQMASPAEIAMDLNMPVELVMRYNEILSDENAAITTPMNIFLQKKKRKYSEPQDFHILKQGETIEMISQQYGIQSKYLYRRNRINPGSQPVVGSKIFLSRKSKFAPNLIQLETAPEMINQGMPASPDPIEPLESNDNPTKTLQSVRTPLEQTMTSLNEQEYYTVKEKDTLYGIAKRFNLTINALKELNQLNLDEIKIGQQLKVR